MDRTGERANPGGSHQKAESMGSTVQNFCGEDRHQDRVRHADQADQASSSNRARMAAKSETYTHPSFNSASTCAARWAEAGWA